MQARENVHVRINVQGCENVQINLKEQTFDEMKTSSKGGVKVKVDLQAQIRLWMQVGVHVQV